MNNGRWSQGLPGLLLCCSLVGVAVADSSPGPDKESAMAKNRWRYSFTSTVLTDGRVLVAGGVAGAGVPSAEIVNPTSGRWQETAGPMAAWRVDAAAVRLADGNVLVTGGTIHGAAARLDSAELFVAATGKWQPLAARMTTPRQTHSATLLADGRVLLAGGLGPYAADGSDPPLSSTEIFDPRTGLFTAARSMSRARGEAAAVHLAGGDVLVVGGSTPIGAPVGEIWRASTGEWRPLGALGAMHHSESSIVRSAVLTADGTVAILGTHLVGAPMTFKRMDAFTVDYDPRTDRLTRLDPAPPFSAFSMSLALLRGREVVVSGGEVYLRGTLIPAWRQLPSDKPFYNARGVALPDGTLLLTDGGLARRVR